MIGELQQRLGMAVLLITHDLGIVAERADEVVVMYAGKVVERAKPQVIFSDPKHPYTIGLLNSTPGVAQRKARLQAIPGMVPNPLHWPAGCRFHDRCSKADSQCLASQPSFLEIKPDHHVACLKVE